MGFNDGLGMASSYYAATANPWREQPALEGEREADLVVVGGGCTGLSAALHAAQAGLSVVVLEGGKVGWGASGRNGGQIIPGLRKGAAELARLHGVERARALLDLAFEARDLVVRLIEETRIACDLKTTGHLLGAAKARDMAWMEAEAECLATVMNYPYVDLLSVDGVREEVATAYHGGLLDRRGGHMHPLNYTLGLAEAALAAGAVIHERSEVTGLATAGGVRVRTPAGAVRARHAVLAGDALLQGLCPRVNQRIMPVANYIAATAPLPDPAALIPHDVAVSDSRFVVNYYRLSADGRLLFGGGERYNPEPPRDMAAFVRGHMEAVFPQVRGVPIDHAWGGLVSVTQTRLPHVGRQGEVLFAHGYSGLGVVLSTLAGKLLVEEILGKHERFDLFAALEPPPFPGGVALRGPLHVLGMLWYALRDRL
ncbi:MAG: oxidoreductase [Caulobacteraceae bacterium]|nr:oxidoreductase [Caulobacteraceae bacterium]